MTFSRRAFLASTGATMPAAAAMARDGRAGDMQTVTVCLGGSREAVPLPVVDPPKSLNWEKWLGQCPLVDYRSAATISNTEGWGAGHPFSRAHRV